MVQYIDDISTNEPYMQELLSKKSICGIFLKNNVMFRIYVESTVYFSFRGGFRSIFMEVIEFYEG